MNAATKNSYRPAEGSVERGHWDLLTEEERRFCDEWIGQTSMVGRIEGMVGHAADETRRKLVLGALGYGGSKLLRI